MSKVKDQMEKLYQEEYERYISFMEYVADQNSKVSESCTFEEEEDSKKPSTPGTSIVPSTTLKSANNVNYNPNRRIR